MDIIINSFETMIKLAFNITGDWGLAIVLLTVVVKLIMLPFSIKQKISMKKQLVFSKKVQEIKEKYKNNKVKQEDELNKLYLSNSKGMIGCFLTFAQLPIISGLYKSVTNLPVEAMTILIPWVMDIGSKDDKFIVPLIYTVISTLPSIISYLKAFGSKEETVSIKSIIPMMIFSIVITIKAPIGLGIYLVTSSLFSLIEDIAFKLYSKNKVFV